MGKISVKILVKLFKYWLFKNYAKAETPVLWPPHAKSWLIGKDWCWEGLGAGEGHNRMRWLDGITDSMDEFEWTLGVGDGQGGLACCNSWGHKESDTTEWLHWTELIFSWTSSFPFSKFGISSFFHFMGFLDNCFLKFPLFKFKHLCLYIFV